MVCKLRNLRATCPGSRVSWTPCEQRRTERFYGCVWDKIFTGFPCGSAGKESACSVRDLGSIPGLGRSPGERLPTPVFWPREFHGLNSPWGHKESDTSELLSVLLSKGPYQLISYKYWWKERRERLPTPVFWPREFHGLNSPWGREESDTTERLSHHITQGPLIREEWDQVTTMVCSLYVCEIVTTSNLNVCLSAEN